MAYATQTDIVEAISENVLKRIASLDTPNTVDAAAVSRALDEASSLADTYLAAYLPIATVPEVLRRAVVSIAVQFLRMGRDQMTEHSTFAYEQAIKWLTAVANGTATLPSTDPEVPNTPASSPALESEDRIFTRCTMSRLF